MLNAGVAQASTGGSEATGNDSESTATKTQTSTVTPSGATNTATGGTGAAGAGVGGPGGTSTGDPGGTGGVGADVLGNSGQPGGPGDTVATTNASGTGSPGTTGAAGTDVTGTAGGPGTTGPDGTTGTIGTPQTGTGAAGAAAAPALVTASFTAGPVTMFTGGDATNHSGGTAIIGTGNAVAAGNVSSTEVVQDLTASSHGGLIVAPETAAVVNAGSGQATTGDNNAVGNDSSNEATLTQTGTLTTTGTVDLGGAGVTVFAGGVASNESDGQGCVCTGDATATGNLSQNLLHQNLDLSVGSLGVVVTPATGLIVNTGVGQANSGGNSATGNDSGNTATSTQTGTIPLGPTSTGAQTLSNAGGASNRSDGSARIGTGRATAVGNLSSTSSVQVATVDAGSGPVVANLFGLTTNTGSGVADSGMNEAVGNHSTNDALLDQSATGQGIVSNAGSADNSSRGSAQIGNPTCDTGTPGSPRTPGAPGGTPSPVKAGAASLPRTGGPIEAEAALALMLLLAGFATRRVAGAFR